MSIGWGRQFYNDNESALLLFSQKIIIICRYGDQIPGVNCTNVLRDVFTEHIPKAQKIDGYTVFFVLLVSVYVKAARKYGKINPWSKFHQHFAQTFLYVQKFVQSQTISRENHLNLLSYEKCASKILMKLMPSVNFINILLAEWTHFFAACLLIIDKLCNFWVKEYLRKSCS